MRRIRWLIFILLHVVLFTTTSCTFLDNIPNETGILAQELSQKNMRTKSNQQKKILRLWTFHTGNEFDYFQSLGQEYQKKNPNIEVKVEYIPSNEYFAGNKLLTAIASGEGPDLFFVSSSTIQKYVQAKILRPFTNEFTPALRSDFTPESLKDVTFNQQIYGIPFEIELLALYYNKQMFSEHGLHPPRTWQELIQSASVLKTETVSGLTIEMDGTIYQNFSWIPFFWQNRVNEFTSDSFKKPEVAATYSFFKQLSDLGLLNRHPSRSATDIGILANGETAMQVTGTWNINSIEENYKEIPMGVVPLPVPLGGEEVTIAGGWKLVVNQLGEESKLASQFAMWAFADDPKRPLEWCTKAKFAYSPRKSVMKAGQSMFNKGFRKEFTEKILATARPEPRLPENINRILAESLQNVLIKNMDGPTASMLASKKLKQIQK
ncbi:multiple sugar transport system substrate-binding protein [Seinonella peptonophila]|uniref:Multiple sugar transport system substrate-binding protein n=1 Tax=Seinonella peptonophila TaxID=112248 RepID=A0A1M4T4C2_9BACL|nr:extracellular solute-binding protein [Seinonella peptonophila]SHE39329.1 multiple sugar transport system substrate-binding protein [Seinonella peptonophila]